MKKILLLSIGCVIIAGCYSIKFEKVYHPKIRGANYPLSKYITIEVDSIVACNASYAFVFLSIHNQYSKPILLDPYNFFIHKDTTLTGDTPSGHMYRYVRSELSELNRIKEHSTLNIKLPYEFYYSYYDQSCVFLVYDGVIYKRNGKVLAHHIGNSYHYLYCK